MFFTIKRRTITAVLIASVLAAGAGALAWAAAHQDAPVFALPSANRVVLIDAGHGGRDAGASDNGVIEKEINLKIALKLQEYIEQSGGVAVLTRDEDESTEDPSVKDGGSYKKSDLTARVEAAKENKADIYVSIHMNKFNLSSRGAQVFYSGNDDKSRILGEIIQQSLKDVLQDGNTRLAKKSGSSIFVLKNATVPAVLVECGFLSNKEEARLLADEAYQAKVAWAIYLGITKYFAEN